MLNFDKGYFELKSDEAIKLIPECTALIIAKTDQLSRRAVNHFNDFYSKPLWIRVFFPFEPYEETFAYCFTMDDIEQLEKYSKAFAEGHTIMIPLADYFKIKGYQI